MPSAGRRRNMQAIRRRDTRPEMRIRTLLHGRGLRYFVDHKPLPGLRNRADMVFPGIRLAVFVDGCFWHGCPAHYSTPRTNSEYWAPKIAGNMARDVRVDQHLTDAGWTVIRVWEHEPPIEVADLVERTARSLTRS